MPPPGLPGSVRLPSQARLIVTDSGALQDESAALGIPCLTMRPKTERPITVEEGTSTLLGSDMDRLRTHLHQMLDGRPLQGRCPARWDGRAAQRIAHTLVQSNRSPLPATPALHTFESPTARDTA